MAYHRNEHGRADIDYHRYRPRPMWVNRGSFGIPSQRTRASRYRLSPISTSPDVGLSRLIWHTIAHFAVSGRHSAEICKRPPPLLFGGRLQISAECPPSSLIGWGQAFSPPPHYLSATAYPSAYNLPFRAGTLQKSASDPLRYSSGDACRFLQSALPPL